MMAVVLVLPAIAQALPGSWRNPVTEFWPTQAGGQITSVHHAAHTLRPWPGFGVMCLFVAITYAIARTLLDAGTHDGGQGASPYPTTRRGQNHVQLILQRHFVTGRSVTVDVMRPPPDDPKVCGRQKTVRWPLASA